MNHTWSFSSVGGVKRVNLEKGSDLVALPYLDQKLWTALSCPVYGLEIDHKTLELIDTEKDGQIRVPNVIEAVNWIIALIKNPDDLLLGQHNLPLNSINTSTDLGKSLYASAKVILENLNLSQDYVSVNETSDFEKIFAGTKFNGDGIITAQSTNQPEVAEAIELIIKTLGFDVDRSGEPGVNLEKISHFFTLCADYLDWYNQGQQNSESVFWLGNDTATAFSIYITIKDKVDDFFMRCNLSAYHPNATSTLNLINNRLEQITHLNLTGNLTELETYPLAEIKPTPLLDLTQGINPAWQNVSAQFYAHIVQPLGLNNPITQNDWQTIKTKFEPYQNWISTKKGTEVESIEIAKLNQLLNSNIKIYLEDLIIKDNELNDEAEHIILVDKLVRYYRDIYKLLNNFVTFYDFYAGTNNASFLAGTLYIDQRSCDLCIKVNQFDKHVALVGLSGMFLMYCECRAKQGDEKMMIVAALTNGDIDNLIVGRNGVFYDRTGKDWDATVVKIIDNPISIRQAFWSPYRKVSNFIEKQVNKFASEQDNKVQSDLTKNVEEQGNKIAAPEMPKASPTPFDIGKFVGIFAAISLALGAIGTAIGSFIAGILALTWWKIPFAFAGILMLISGPAMIMAYLKLRKRNLAPILDANGWAINARAIVNIPFGNTLTHMAELPLGAKVNLNDPFMKKGRPWWHFVLIIGVLIGGLAYLLWKFGYMHF